MDSRREKARQLVEAGCVFPVPGLPSTAVVLSSDRSMPYVVTFGTGQEACTCLDFEMRQGKVGLLCKHIIAVKQDAAADAELDAQVEKEIGRIRARRSLALLNDDDESYNRLTQEWPHVWPDSENGPDACYTTRPATRRESDDSHE